MPASIAQQLTDDQRQLIAREETLRNSMKDNESRVKDLVNKDNWSDADEKEYTEIKAQLSKDTAQFNAVQDQLKSMQSEVDLKKSRQFEGKKHISERSIIGQIDNFIRNGSTPKLSKEDEEALQKSGDMAEFYERAKASDGSTNMLRIPIPEGTFMNVMNRTPISPKATITADDITSESESGVEGAQATPSWSDYSATLTETLDANIIYSLTAWGGLARWVRTFTTATGNNLRIPRLDPGNATGTWIQDTEASGAPSSAQRKAAALKPTPSPTDVTLMAHLISSGIVSISLVAEQDSMVNIEATVLSQMTRRIGRSLAQAVTSGTALTTDVTVRSPRQTPIGVSEFAGNGGTSRASGKVDWEDLFRMVNTIDAAYLMNSETTDPRSGNLTSMGGQAAFMINRDIEQAIMLERDSDNRPIWIQNLATGSFNMLRGYPYFLNFELPALAASSKSAYFGLWNHYATRIVREIVLFRMTDSKFIEKYSIGLVQFARFDGYHVGPVDSSGKAHAYKVLTTKA